MGTPPVSLPPPSSVIPRQEEPGIGLIQVYMSLHSGEEPTVRIRLFQGAPERGSTVQFSDMPTFDPETWAAFKARWPASRLEEDGRLLVVDGMSGDPDAIRQDVVNCFSLVHPLSAKRFWQYAADAEDHWTLEGPIARPLAIGQGGELLITLFRLITRRLQEAHRVRAISRPYRRSHQVEMALSYQGGNLGGILYLGPHGSPTVRVRTPESLRYYVSWPEEPYITVADRAPDLTLSPWVYLPVDDRPAIVRSLLADLSEALPIPVPTT
jgi:hypothetical protein